MDNKTFYYARVSSREQNPDGNFKSLKSLGHASSDITSSVYAHIYAEVKTRITKTVSNALFNR